MWEADTKLFADNNGSHPRLLSPLVRSAAHHPKLCRWNMNGNLIDPVPFQRRPEEASEGVSAAHCDAILLEITHPRVRRLVCLRSAHPVISLVMWEWWSRDNGTLSLHMRQEDSLWAPDRGRMGDSLPVIAAISTVASWTRSRPRPECRRSGRESDSSTDWNNDKVIRFWFEWWSSCSLGNLATWSLNLAGIQSPQTFSSFFYESDKCSNFYPLLDWLAVSRLSPPHHLPKLPGKKKLTAENVNTDFLCFKCWLLLLPLSLLSHKTWQSHFKVMKMTLCLIITSTWPTMQMRWFYHSATLRNRGGSRILGHQRLSPEGAKAE